MKLTWQDHLAFWKALKTRLWEEHLPILTGLEDVAADVKDTPFAASAAKLPRLLEETGSLADSLTGAGVFPDSILTMVRAAETGGVLDGVTDRIIAGLEDRSLRPSGDEPNPSEEPARFFRCFGHLLMAGVPILTIFDVLREEITRADLKEVAKAGGLRIMDGDSFHEVLEAYPGLFPRDILAAVQAGEEEGTLDEAMFAIAEGLAPGGKGGGPGKPQGPESDTQAAMRFLDDLLTEAVKTRATEAHLDIFETGPRTRLRVDGVLHEKTAPPLDLYKGLVNRIKILARMDVAEQRLPQDTRVRLTLEGRETDIRISTLPTLFGERVVLRFLDRRQALLTLDDLGFAPAKADALRRLTRLPHGLLICSGPAGSGKTTTLYALVAEVNQPGRCVISVEDPVEYAIPGIAQVQVNSRFGLTYAKALRAALRQAPNVLLLGDLDDAETLDLTLEAAETGHLLLAQVHADSALSTVQRLTAMGPDPYLFGSALAGVVAQRLVRALCLECAEPAKPDLTDLPEAARKHLEALPERNLKTGRGCAACNGTGYRGRRAVNEILVPDENLRTCLRSNPDAKAIAEAVQAMEMKPMLFDALEEAARGVTSVEEVLRVVPL